MKNRHNSATKRHKERIRIGAFLVTPYTAKDRPPQWRVEADKKVWGSVRRKYFVDKGLALDWALKQNEIYEGGDAPPEPTRSPRTEDSKHSVGTVVGEYLKDRKSEVSPGQLKQLNNHLDKLIRRFSGLHVDSLEPLICRQWLRGLVLSQRTKHGVFVTCRTFYRWAMRYNKATTNPFDRMEPIPKGDAPKAILEPKEMEMLLARDMAPYVRAWLVLGGFCGLRPVEIEKSDWSAVDWKNKEFHVRPEVTKRDRLRNRGLRERIVAIPETAMRLLPRGLTGDIVPVKKNTMQDQVRRLAVALAEMRGEELRKKKGWRRGKVIDVPSADWPHDCLRHSAATYRLAELGDAGPVAQWLGHTTTKMLHDNYARPKSKTAAAEWWAMKDPRGVIPMPQAKAS